MDFENIEINDCFVEDEKVINDLVEIKKQLLGRNRIYRITIEGVTLLLITGMVFLFSRFYRYISFMSSNRIISITMSVIIVLIFVVIFFRTMMAREFNHKQHSFMEKYNDTIRRSLDYQNLRFMYEDMKAKNMVLYSLEENRLHVKAHIGGKEKMMIMPFKFNIKKGSTNRIDFYNDHLDIFLKS